MPDQGQPEEPAQSAQTRGSGSPAPQQAAERDVPDSTLVVTRKENTLSYALNGRKVGSVTLEKSPEGLLEPMYDFFNTWARQTADERSAEDTRDALRWLRNIGIALYRQLFPEKFKRDEYVRLRNRHGGGNLTITTNESWIPWEIVRPYEYDDRRDVVLYDDPPLCETFRLSRWSAGTTGPVELALRRAVVVQPPDNLARAQTERAYFAALPALRPGLTIEDPLETVDATLESFVKGGTHLYHFACHGNFDLTNPAFSQLKLGERRLSPLDIDGDAIPGLHRAHPLVFINACFSGRRAPGLTRLDGWAERFLAAGASAFIGSLWEINDALASRFAAEFYNRLFGVKGHRPLPIAEAFGQARQVIKALDPANPTWLAYVLYANPHAQVERTSDVPPTVAEAGRLESAPVAPAESGTYSERLKAWLEYWSFIANPFAAGEPDRELTPPDKWLLDRGYITRTCGDPLQPAHAVLMGPPGSGKSAALEHIWNDLVKKQIRAFPVRYTDFGFLVEQANEAPRQAPRHHLHEILRSGFYTLANHVGEAFFEQLRADERGRLQSLSRIYADPDCQERLARLAPVEETVKIHWEDARPKEVLRAFVDLVTRPAPGSRRTYEAVYVLVDRVDALVDALRENGSQDALADALLLLKPLLLAGGPLETPRVAFKLFLPTTIGKSLLAGWGSRKRPTKEQITWDNRRLVDMVNYRLGGYRDANVSDSDPSRPNASDIALLFSSRAAGIKINELVDHCHNSPYELLLRLDKMLRDHLERRAGPLFDLQDIEQALHAARR